MGKYNFSIHKVNVFLTLRTNTNIHLADHSEQNILDPWPRLLAFIEYQF